MNENCTSPVHRQNPFPHTNCLRVLYYRVFTHTVAHIRPNSMSLNPSLCWSWTTECRQRRMKLFNTFKTLACLCEVSENYLSLGVCVTKPNTWKENSPGKLAGQWFICRFWFLNIIKQKKKYNNQCYMSPTIPEILWQYKDPYKPTHWTLFFTTIYLHTDKIRTHLCSPNTELPYIVTEWRRPECFDRGSNVRVSKLLFTSEEMPSGKVCLEGVLPITLKFQGYTYLLKTLGGDESGIELRCWVSGQHFLN